MKGNIAESYNGEDILQTYGRPRPTEKRKIYIISVRNMSIWETYV